MFFRLCFTLLPVFVPALVLAQSADVEYNWEEKRNRSGIAIYTSEVEGSPYRAVRGAMFVKGSIHSLVALIEDYEVCPEWAALCKEARVVERVSPTETYAYFYNDVPFPVSDRDAYTHIRWTLDESGRVTMTSIAQEGGVPESKAVRLKDAITQWHFSDQGDGTVLVENFAHIDPNGPTPAWITNMLLIDSPYESMRDMRKLIEAGEYADAHFDFIESQKSNDTRSAALEIYDTSSAIETSNPN